MSFCPLLACFLPFFYPSIIYTLGYGLQSRCIVYSRGAAPQDFSAKSSPVAQGFSRDPNR